jgi:type IV pilus assembly protein PilA
MIKIQRGFSIVELMIVLSIIYVITWIVNPIYANYSTRAKIAEALTLLAGLKNPMEKYYHSQNEWPSVVAVGEKNSGHYTSRIVSGEMNNDLFYVEATMKGDEILGEKQLRMTYEPSTRDWVCTINDVENPIPSQYLPAYCRD